MSWPRATAAVLFVLTGCSLVVGELPDPLPADAGAQQSGGANGAVSGAGTSSAGHAGTSAAGGSTDVPDAGPTTSGGSDAAQSDAAPPIGGNDAGFDACDRDGDGERSEDCGGDDSNDDDRNVFSTQDRYFDHASDESYDYNCDGEIEIEYPQSLSCSIEACELATQGFLDDPLRPCGDLGAWGKCVPDNITGLMCESQMIGMRRVACR